MFYFYDVAIMLNNTFLYLISAYTSSRGYITIRTPKLCQRHYKTGQQMGSAAFFAPFSADPPSSTVLLPRGGVVSFVLIPNF